MKEQEIGREKENGQRQARERARDREMEMKSVNETDRGR